MSARYRGWWYSLYKAEHAGAIALLLVATILFAIPRLAGVVKPALATSFLADSASLAKLENMHKQNQDSFYRHFKRKKINLTYASTAELIESGFSNEHATKIATLMKSGRKFHSYAELSKATGLDSHKLIGIVSPGSFNSKYYDREQDEKVLVDINLADTTALIKLPGIGSKTALRIITYRNKLGGFYHFNQLKETYNVDTNRLNELENRFIINLDAIKKIAINTVTEAELEAHPYISKTQAKVIIAYRNQHGQLNFDEFSKIQVMTNFDKLRIKPYLDFTI
jgi:competence protein ComEA